MAQTRAALLERLIGLCEAAPLSWRRTLSPLDFKALPNAVLDGAFRLTVAQLATSGRFSTYVDGAKVFVETQTDTITIRVARQHKTDAQATQLALAADLHALRAAILRDARAGDYLVVDGGSATIEPVPERDFSVGTLALPINYEVLL